MRYSYHGRIRQRIRAGAKKDRPEGGASERQGPQTYEKTENDRKSIVAQFLSFRKSNLEDGEGASPHDMGTVFHDRRDRLLYQRAVPGDRSD